MLLERCTLQGFRVGCGQKIDGHHLIPKSFLRGCRRAQKYVKEHWDFFGIPMCNVHNAQTKLADVKAAQPILWREQIRVWGRPKCEAMLAGLRTCYKVEPMELRLEALLG